MTWPASYFILRELDFELDIAKRTLASRQESLRIIKLRQERGVSNMLEVRQAEELVYDATEDIPVSGKVDRATGEFSECAGRQKPRTNRPRACP